MRYGQVYFYDRMGNREPRESDRVQAALDNFSAPRFPPPTNAELSKRYLPKFTPLTSPEPLEMGLPLPSFQVPPLDPNHSHDWHGSSFPPHEEHEPPRSLDPLYLHRRGESLASEMEEAPFRNRREDQDDLAALTRNIDGFRMNGEGDAWNGLEREEQCIVTDTNIPVVNGSEFGRLRAMGDIRRIQNGFDVSTQEYLEHSNEICDQCRAEEEFQDRLRKEQDENDKKAEEVKRRVMEHAAQVARKEAEQLQQEAESRRLLQQQINAVNAEMIESRKSRIKSPPMDYRIFRQEDALELEGEKRKKQEKFEEELAEQMNRRRDRLIRESERDEQLAIQANNNAANQLAGLRYEEAAQASHDRRSYQKTLEFQMEMGRRRKQGTPGMAWWEMRPDEHGWREARGRRHYTQQDIRNNALRDSIKQLEDFKRRQEEYDEDIRLRQQNRFAFIRENLHAAAEKLRGPTGADAAKGAAAAREAAAAAWQAAHEQNDKRYRVLQEAVGREKVGIALPKQPCRRCVRCSRPLRGHLTSQIALL